MSKLNQDSKFNIKIKSGTPKVDDLILSDIAVWSIYNIWSLRRPLYMIEDLNHNDGIVLTLEQIEKLIPELQKILTEQKRCKNASR